LILSVSDDISHLGDESFEIVHERLSRGGLCEGEASSDEYDEAEYNTQVEVRLILFLVFLNGETKEAEESTEPEEEREDTSHLLDEEAVPWDGSLIGESVRTVSLGRLKGLGGGESVLDVSAEMLGELNFTHALFSPVTDVFGLGDGVTHTRGTSVLATVLL